MITVLTTSNSAVLRQLGSRPFQRLGVRHRLATTGPEALEIIQRERPSLCIVDTELPEMDGYELCSRVKGDPELRGTRVMLVVGSMMDRAQIEKLGNSGCDDVFSVPAPSDELYQHAARLLNLPHRQDRRIQVQVRIEINAGAQVIAGRVENISSTGAKVILEAPVVGAKEVRLRLFRTDDERAAVVRGRVVWQRPDESGGLALGVEFFDLLPEMQRMLADLALWDIVDTEGGAQVILHGDFTEITDFDPLRSHLTGRVEFDLSGVRYMNSSGVRNWAAFLRLLREVDYTFVRCSVAFTSQAGMVPAVVGRGRIESFLAPYHCDECDRSEERLLQTAALTTPAPVIPPRFRCSQCGGELAFDDVAERYFAFLEHGPPVV
ncbi:MAG TPA: PilZ domain-containing protein [Polyangia bacterium]|jgi:CheY-like chemotaxis protein